MFFYAQKKRAAVMGNPLEFVGLGSLCYNFYRLKTDSQFWKSGKGGVTVE